MKKNLLKLVNEKNVSQEIPIIDLTDDDPLPTYHTNSNTEKILGNQDISLSTSVRPKRKNVEGNIENVVKLIQDEIESSTETGANNVRGESAQEPDDNILCIRPSDSGESLMGLTMTESIKFNASVRALGEKWRNLIEPVCASKFGQNDDQGFCLEIEELKMHQCFQSEAEKAEFPHAKEVCDLAAKITNSSPFIPLPLPLPREFILTTSNSGTITKQDNTHSIGIPSDVTLQNMCQSNELTLRNEDLTCPVFENSHTDDSICGKENLNDSSSAFHLVQQAFDTDPVKIPFLEDSLLNDGDHVLVNGELANCKTGKEMSPDRTLLNSQEICSKSCESPTIGKRKTKLRPKSCKSHNKMHPGHSKKYRDLIPRTFRYGNNSLVHIDGNDGLGARFSSTEPDGIQFLSSLNSFHHGIGTCESRHENNESPLEINKVVRDLRNTFFMNCNRQKYVKENAVSKTNACIQNKAPIMPAPPSTLSTLIPYESQASDSNACSFSVSAVPSKFDSSHPHNFPGVNSYASFPVNTIVDLNTSQSPSATSEFVPLPSPKLCNIGVDVMTTDQVLAYILGWNTSWLKKPKSWSILPPICNNLKYVMDEYRTYEDYYNTYLPPFLLEVWQRICDCFNPLTKSYCAIPVRMIHRGCLSTVEFQTRCNICEGTLVLVMTEDTPATSIFGYCLSDRCVEHRFNSKQGYLNVNIACIGKSTLGRVIIKPITNLRLLISQVLALRTIAQSPLCNAILQPSTPMCNIVHLPKVTSSVQSISSAVTTVMNSLDFGNPLSCRLTVAETFCSADVLPNIVALVEYLKHSMHTKVLICVRSAFQFKTVVKYLQDSRKVKFVAILSKETKCDESVPFSLDHLVSLQLKYAKNAYRLSSEELYNEGKRTVLGASDVVLSYVTNSFSSDVQEAVQLSASRFVCIIDEAHMCTELESLVPLMLGLKKFIFFGRPQVKTFVQTEIAKKCNYTMPLIARVRVCLRKNQ